MKSLLFIKPNNIEIIDKELRKPESNELIIKIDTCGVCGTDFHIFRGESLANENTILGHEFSGTVYDNNNIADFNLGDKVVVDPNIYCGTCYYCRQGKINFCINHKALGVTEDGGFAEYAIVPAKQAYKIPSYISLSTIAFAEPLSCCLRAINKTIINAGESVIIFGGGSIGLLMLQLVKLRGASKVILIEPITIRQQLAQKLGADYVFAPNENNLKTIIYDITHGGADTIIDCVGKPEILSLSIELINRGGKIILFGVPPIHSNVSLELHKIFLNELTITSSYLNPYTFNYAIELLVNHKIDVEQLPVKKVDIESVKNILESGADESIIKYQFHN